MTLSLIVASLNWETPLLVASLKSKGAVHITAAAHMVARWAEQGKTSSHSFAEFFNAFALKLNKSCRPNREADAITYEHERCVSSFPRN